MNDFLSSLNINQKRAVTAPFDVPIVVIAGAGTGKTKVLTTRIMYLLEELEYTCENILALTFTNKAAFEMVERIERAGFPKITWMSTYSSLGLKILKEDIGKLNRNNNFVVIDEEEQNDIILTIKRRINNVNLTDAKLSKSPRVIIGIINDIYTIFFDEIYNNNFSKILNSKNFWWKYHLNDKEKQDIFDIFCQYHELKKNDNYVDYNDLLNLPLIIFENDPITRQKWQKRFSYILVDEFQDTSYLQFKFLLYLYNPNQNNLFVVGDPDQTIYTWRGAYPHIFKDLYQKFPNCIKITLDKNYRSTQNILDAGNQVISCNKNRDDKKLFSDKKNQELVNIYIGETKEKQWNFVVNEIEKLKTKYEYKDMVILYRSKNETQMVENKFIVKQIPYKIFGGIKFWQRREIKDILSFLKLSVNNNDELALKRIIYFTKAGIGETKIENINKTAKENNISFFEALKFETNPKIISFIKKVEEILNEIINLSISQSIEKIIEKTKYYDFLTNEYEVTDALEREQNVKELINTALVKEKEIENKYISIPDFLNEISLYISSNDTIVQGNDFVSLMTIHHAKGLEFKIVFVVGMVDGIFPNNNTDNYEEERRLAYVAITRAKEILYLCGYKEVTGYLRDWRMPTVNFQFIKEAQGIHARKIQDSYKTLNELKNDFFDSTKNIPVNERYNEFGLEIDIGDFIIHTVFGQGQVIGKNCDEIDVIFNTGKTMKLNSRHKSISKKVI